jgi:hypothetical protein
MGINLNTLTGMENNEKYHDCERVIYLSGLVGCGICIFYKCNGISNGFWELGKKPLIFHPKLPLEGEINPFGHFPHSSALNPKSSHVSLFLALECTSNK